ncbi:MAG TPA: DUF4038 domain-containing protein [Streptosporangiaceae bacterium]|nr:DUF4038 domain-containing protein [Streptosporangiaceae bacterium]
MITGLATDATTGGHFTDQYGSPRLWVATETWGLPVNAGNWSSPGYQHDYDTFFADRAGQGFTVTMTDPVWAEPQATAYSGNDWDGTTPLAGGSTNPSSAALNSAFWTRIDYMFSSAAAQGITIGMVLYNGDGVGNGGTLQNTWTTTQWTDWATKVGARYKNTQNLVWLVGNDAFSPGSDSQWDAIQAGLAAAGDSHLIAAWYNAECTSRYVTDTNTAEPWGVSHSAFNFCYTYNAGYWIAEYAYLEVADEGASSLLPVVWGDGFFYPGSPGAYFATYDRAMRQEWWWWLASGGRGILGEAENVYPWTSSSAAAVTGDWFFANNAANIVAAFTGLAGWHLLVPDTSNALVTGGRGTRVSGFASGGSGGQYEESFVNSYVAASRTPDSGSGSHLAVLYLPNHTTITIDQAKMAAGYTATWVDPVSGATSAATAGGTPPSVTYNSTAKGANSEGDPDWVLVLQG